MIPGRISLARGILRGQTDTRASVQGAFYLRVGLSDE